MGLGLPGAVGIAMAKKLKKEEGMVYVLMSDGEIQCGTTWESALIAKHFKLNNLVVMVDNNGWQAMGKTKEILNYENGTPFHGWAGIACEINDKNFLPYSDIQTCLDLKKQDDLKEMPLFIRFDTLKGRGVSFMENNNLYHYKQLSEQEYNDALVELYAI
jgi:transketolase